MKKRIPIFPRILLRFNFTNFFIVGFILLYVHSLKDSNNHYIYNENDTLLFLTNSGFLYSYKYTKNTINNVNPLWKLYVGEQMFSKNINSYKITNNIFIHIINEKLYIIKNNVLIPFDQFVKNVINKDNENLFNDDDDFVINGIINNSYFVIDLNEGKILEIFSEGNSYNKKKFNNNKNIIIVKKVEYILKKVEKFTKKILMNVSINDFVIDDEYHIIDENFNEREDINKLFENMNIKITNDEIIFIYKYSTKDKKLNLLYNKSILNKNEKSNDMDNKKNSYNENDIKEFIKEYCSVLLKKLRNYNIFYTIVIISSTSIILIMILKSFPQQQTINLKSANIINENYIQGNLNSTSINFATNYNPKNKDNNQICHNIENIFIKPTKPEQENNEKVENNEENMKLIKYQSNVYLDFIKHNNKTEKKPKKSNVIYIDKERSHSSIDLVGRKNNLSFKYDIYENQKDDINYDDYLVDNNIYTKSNDIIIDKINSSEIEKIIEPIEKKLELKSSRRDPINKQMFIKMEENIKNIITFKIPENEYQKYINYFKQKNLLPSDDINNNNNKLLQKKNESKNLSKKTIKKGIWDDSLDEDEDDIDESEIKENNNNINKIGVDNNNNGNIKKEKIIKSRIDEDFKNLEKIGEGGFGVVLKGIHRLDKGVNAIKIIKLSSISDKDSIINEAITMTKISSKHIVQYKTCWIDNLLGSAQKFFNKDDEDDSDEENSITNLDINNLSKSCILKKGKNQKKNEINKIIENSNESLNSDSDSENYIINTPLQKNKKCKDILLIKNKKDNSQEIAKKSSSNIISNYYNDYRDDSRIIKESIISKKYNKNETSSGKYFFILMEYCDGLTLEQYIHQHSNKSIDRKIIYSLTYQILKSLSKIHSSGIIHRDIKPSNIFIKNDQIKIGDFGLATRYSTSSLLKSKKIEGTPLYLSPEQMSFKTYNEKVDIYACGITLYEMCSCFYTSMERYEGINNLKNNQIISDTVKLNYPQETELIKLMTTKDYNERPSANDILKSDLFINLGKLLGF